MTVGRLSALIRLAGEVVRLGGCHVGSRGPLPYQGVAAWPQKTIRAARAAVTRVQRTCGPPATPSDPQCSRAVGGPALPTCGRRKAARHPRGQYAVYPGSESQPRGEDWHLYHSPDHAGTLRTEPCHEPDQDYERDTREPRTGPPSHATPVAPPPATDSDEPRHQHYHSQQRPNRLCQVTRPSDQVRFPVP